MLQLPDSLPAQLIPLAWLLGSWKGWGTGQSLDHPNQQFYLIQEASFSPEGQHLQQTVRTWRAKDPGVSLPVDLDAKAGLGRLRRGELLWEERATWTVLEAVPAGPEQDQPRSISRFEAQGGPYREAISWQATSLGPRIMAEGECRADQQLKAVSRLFGLVYSELFWAQEATVRQVLPDGSETVTDFSARLARWELS